jgi:hypothetical protein
MKQRVNAFFFNDESYSISSIFYARQQQMEQRLAAFCGLVWTVLLAQFSK